MDKTSIRDAATIIVLRDRASNPRILMGQRGAKAVFMPNKFVFPGGAVDAGDRAIPLAKPVAAPCAARLADQSTLPANALAAAAIRELWEETGQILGTAADWPDAPQGWRGFARTGHRPSPDGLQFVFRAITPKGLPRRFDARFFLVDADALASDPDDFTNAEDELRGLQWIPLAQARDFDLPFITQVVLAEVSARVHDTAPPATVPFFRNDDEATLVAQLGGDSPLR